MRYVKLSLPQRWIVKGIPILFFIGSLLHFLYDFSANNALVGAIAPVNESVWEHLKMTLLPTISWWVVYYFVSGRKHNVDKNKWFTGALVSLLVALLTVPLLFYFYTGAFGVESLIIDILLLAVAFLFGQLVGLHFYNHHRGISSNISIAMFILITLIFILFTFYTPYLPIFRDDVNGTYGIYESSM